jgi:hypothetical protein
MHSRTMTILSLLIAAAPLAQKIHSPEDVWRRP